MLLRRMIAHVKAQNWTAVALDFVIVVVGVFIGIQVSNWNAARADRNTEKTYLELLQHDLRQTIEDVENQIAFEQFQIAIANMALPIIGEPPSDVRKARLGMILTQLAARRTLKIDSPTFLDLRSSGRLRLISDPDLRSDIVTYFFSVQRWEAVIDKNNEHFVDVGFNGFIDDLSVGWWLWDEETMERAAPTFVNIILTHRDSYIDPQLMQAGGGVLMAPADAPLWDEVKTRLGKRANIASANESIGATLRDATIDIEAKIAAYLEERK